MLSTSFIVARQPAAESRQEGFSRNSVNSVNFGTYVPASPADLLDRGREKASRTKESNYQMPEISEVNSYH